jgi:hypothetical protein
MMENLRSLSLKFVFIAHSTTKIQTCIFGLLSVLKLRAVSTERTRKRTDARCQGEVVSSSFTCFDTARLVLVENGTINLVVAAGGEYEFARSV